MFSARSIASLASLLTLISASLLPTHAQTLLYSIQSPYSINGGLFGFGVKGIPDVNRDGIPDLAIGAQSETVIQTDAAGRCYVMDGSNGDLLVDLHEPVLQSGSKFGQAFSALPDMNSDTIPEIVVGAYGSRVNNLNFSGRAYIMNPADGTVLHTLQSPAPQIDGWFGHSVSSAGECNGDTVCDVIIGARKETVNRVVQAGHAYLFNGANGTLLHTLQSPNPETSGWFGHLVGELGDITGDGRSDVFVTASQETVNGRARAGRIYTFNGATGALIRTIASPIPYSNGGFGVTVDLTGDVDGDGFTDFIVSASGDSLPQWGVRGVAYVINPVTGVVIYNIYTQNPNPFPVRGVACAGLVTNDTLPDFLCGTASAVYLFDGESGNLLWTLNAPIAGGTFGSFCDGIGDVNGDGRGDFIVGDYNINSQQGAAYVYSGVTLSAGEYRSEITNRFALRTNPNPFNSSTVVHFQLPVTANVELKLFNSVGNQVRALTNQVYPAGSHQVSVSGNGFSSGSYFLRMEANGKMTEQKIVLIK
ncbi:MAG: T9SS type A sorting domain-containing protein [bacterium]|nr:T9SS type A sorting domain-containing protein [bacterium]